MNGKAINRMSLSKALLVVALLSVSAQTFAAEYWLRAQAFNLNLKLPGVASIPMWGFAECEVDGAGLWECEKPSIPGPELNVLPGDTSGLTVHLRNSLPEPVSLVINGQTTAMIPVWTDGTSGPRTSAAQRVRSFTHEAAARTNGVDGEATYTWPAVKPGTYLYQSGTHPQVQVQMGLYGAMTKSTAVSGPIEDGVQQGGQIYGTAYNRTLTLLFSEIDPALHAAVANGTYGTDLGPTSTLNYDPKYFLINGRVNNGGKKSLIQLKAGQRTLLRFLNAGLQSRVPMISSGHFSVIAEDGNAYPWAEHPRQQYSVFLPAAKTMDVIYVGKIINSQDALYALYDRRLALNNAADPNGGMMAHIEVKKVGNPPRITSPLADSMLAATQDVPFSVQVAATDPEANPITYTFDVSPVGMSITPNVTGALISWTPDSAQVGPNPVTVRASDTTGWFSTRSFTVSVANVSDAPLAVDDSYTIMQGTTLSVAMPGVLANDSDADADPITAVNYSLASQGAVTGNADGSFVYTPPVGFTGPVTFGYQDDDGELSSNPAKVVVNVIANRPPEAHGDTASAPIRRNIATTGDITANTNTLTVASTAWMKVGYPITVRGAGMPDLATAIAGIDGNVLTLASPADATVVGAEVTVQYRAVLINALANDVDPDTEIDSANRIDPATVTIVTSPNQGGAVSVDPVTGVISYTPSLNFGGADSFTYTVRDTRSATSNTVMVRVNVM